MRGDEADRRGGEDVGRVGGRGERGICRRRRSRTSPVATCHRRSAEGGEEKRIKEKRKEKGKKMWTL